MNNLEFDNNIRMVRLGDDDICYDNKLTTEYISLKKRVSKMHSEARNNAKLQHCFLCGKECSSFCNSHSVPQFALYGIADNGLVSEALQNKVPMHEKPIGVGRTGTFQCICNNCDNQIFQDYENPDAYSKVPTPKMIAQIALKNYLLLIHKRFVERELYTLLGKKNPNAKGMADEKIFIGELDLQGYLLRLKYAQKAIKKDEDKYYHLCYYNILDYVVPYAAQAAITLVGDFDDEVINNLYSVSIGYEMKEIHVAVFPLKTTSVVMLFIEDGEKRYGKFCRQFKKLSPEDKLSAINYIIFSNSENVFLNPKVQEMMRRNKEFMDICVLTADTTSTYYCSPKDLLAKAIKEFSLSKRHNIPNLLSREYALLSNTEVE